MPSGRWLPTRRPTDVVTVSEQLERHGQARRCRRPGLPRHPGPRHPTAANVRAYAEIVRERSLLRQLIKAGTEIAASAFSNEGETARELVDQAEQGVFEIAEAGHAPAVARVRVAEMLPAVIDQIDEWHSNPGQDARAGDRLHRFRQDDRRPAPRRPGHRCGPSLDGQDDARREHGRVRRDQSQHPRVGGHLQHGNALRADHHAHAGLDRRRAAQQPALGRIADEDWVRITSATSQLSEAKIFIDETPALTPTELRARARRLKREHGLGLVVVDYLQLMQVPGTKENRATEIAEISRGLKALAKELAVPVIALSQLNRGVEQREQKKPVMSDLRECVTGDTLVCLTDGRRVPDPRAGRSGPEVWSLDEQQQ